MNKGFLSVIVFIGVFSRADASQCIQYFANQNNITSSAVNFYRTYSEVAKGVSFDMSQKSPLESLDVYSITKRRFLERNASHLLALLKSGEFSYIELVKARVFHAETVSTEYSKPYSNVMVVNGKVYSFALDGSSVHVLNQSQIGFLANRVDSLRLDREFIITFGREDQVRIFDAKLKDPATLEKLVNSGRVEAAFAKFYSEYSKDIADILVSHAGVNIQSLLQSQIMKGTVASNNSEIYMVTIDADVVYFSKSKNFEGHRAHRNWGVFSTEIKIGFRSGINDQITLSDGKTVFDVLGSKLVPSKETLVTNALLAFGQIVSNAHMSSYRSNFLRSYKSEVQKLIEAGELSGSDVPMHRLEVAVSEMNPAARFYVLPVASGFAYFRIGAQKESGLLKEIDVDRYGTQFSTSNYRLLEVRKKVGFTAAIEVAELLPESDAQAIRAYSEKVKVALGLKELSVEQSKRLSDVARLLEQLNMDLNGAVQGRDANQLMEVVKVIISVMMKDNVFTKEQAEEFVKMSIGFPIKFDPIQ